MLLSNDTKEILYSGGYELYRNGKYAEAIHFFRFLTLNEPTTVRSWMGLGASHQMNKEYHLALQAYAIAAEIDNSKPEVHLHAAECCFAIERNQDGQEALERASQLITCEEQQKQLDAICKVWCDSKKHEVTHGN